MCECVLHSNTPSDLLFYYTAIKHVMEIHKYSTTKHNNFKTSLKSVL